jgi:hypothetical protein
MRVGDGVEVGEEVAVGGRVGVGSPQPDSSAREIKMQPTTKRTMTL